MINKLYNNKIQKNNVKVKKKIRKIKKIKIKMMKNR